MDYGPLPTANVTANLKGYLGLSNLSKLDWLGSYPISCLKGPCHSGKHYIFFIDGYWLIGLIFINSFSLEFMRFPCDHLSYIE